MYRKWEITIPAPRSPMNAMNSPMPTDMARVRFFGTEAMIMLRIFVTERKRNTTPEMNTAPSAVCQGRLMPRTTE